MSETVPMNDADYDFVVIGGGSAGYAAARTAAGLGLRTAVIEGGDELGGLCILRGCMPSKSIIESANRHLVLRNAREFGLSLSNPQVHLPEVIDRKRTLVADFASHRADQLQDGPFDLIRGRARFLDHHRLAVEVSEGTREVRARSFLIATGSFIPEPRFEGARETGWMTSDDMLAKEDLPPSIIILGGGAIALEAAHYYEGMGAKVTLIQRSPQVLKEMDADVAGAVQEAFQKRGMQLHLGTKILRWERAGEMKRVIFEQNGEIHTAEAAEILCALGRSPATPGMQLEEAGVETDAGRVRCQPTQQSTAPHIFAAGDVCGPYEIVHIAIQQGELAARNAARLLGKLPGQPEKMDYRLRMMGIFCEPQVATVGHSEKSAGEAGLKFRTASYPFADHGKSMVKGETEGFVKLLAEEGSGQLLGGAVVGPQATELIHEIAVAMYFRGTAADLASVPHYHPTLSEIWTYPADDLA